jgi:hypothetical protein
MNFFASKGGCSVPSLCFYERGVRALSKRTEVKVWRALARETRRQRNAGLAPDKLEQELAEAVELTTA